jgi:hypothetical protein
MSEEMQGPSSGGDPPVPTEQDGWAFFVPDRYQMYHAWWRKKMLEDFSREYLLRQLKLYLQSHDIHSGGGDERTRDQIAGAVQDNLPD